LRHGIAHVAIDLLDRAGVDHRADLRARVGGRADLQRADAGRQLVDEALMHRLVHVDAVRADAGLAAVAELGDHQAFDRGVQVGVVEHDEGRVAAQLQRQLLQRARRIARARCLPTGVEPVKVILRTRASASQTSTTSGVRSREASRC
jgi:methylaspartate ammonia-lyase